jgi:hypothetical protein
VTPDAASRPIVALVGAVRAGAGAVVLTVLVYAYVLRIAVGDGNPFDYFGYFTNQTSLLASVVLIVVGALGAGALVGAASRIRGIGPPVVATPSRSLSTQGSPIAPTDNH